jgi:hypothetical protein
LNCTRTVGFCDTHVLPSVGDTEFTAGGKGEGAGEGVPAGGPGVGAGVGVGEGEGLGGGAGFGVGVVGVGFGEKDAGATVPPQPLRAATIRRLPQRAKKEHHPAAMRFMRSPATRVSNE